MVLQTDQFGNVINTGTTFGRQAEAAEQGMLGLSNFMAMGGGFDEFLVRMDPQRALGNLPKRLTAGEVIKPSDIAAIKKIWLVWSITKCSYKSWICNTRCT